nr:PREDICTED: natural cytotoxicity triggering receptor 1 [Rhinolophus sinicus]
MPCSLGMHDGSRAPTNESFRGLNLEVFCLIQKIQAQEGELPIPKISAVPSSVIPWNASVKIQCSGIPESYLYQLEILKNSTSTVVEKRWGFQEVAEFIIKRMDTNTAGRYQCQYRKTLNWSKHSEALELVVTGLYEKPFLSTDQGLVMMPGQNISLQCGSAHIPLDRFVLTKEGEASLPQHQTGEHQGNFTLGPVNLSFSGNYRCYGWHSGSPYVWSAPSDALELVVTDTMNQGYTVENLIRMGVAGLILVALLAILAESWHSHKVPNKAHLEDLPELTSSTQKCQPSRICAMLSTLIALLCLGLYLSQRISSQMQFLSKPIIWAKPNFMIPSGMPVIIWCQGTHKAIEYELHFEGHLSASETPNPPGMTNKVNFSIQTMTSHTAGQYKCLYRSGEHWSEPSDPLDLVLTGMYDKPTLSVHPGAEVISGENVTFYCRLETATSTFFLIKEGRSSRPQHKYGNIQADFYMGPVTTAHRGTYRCFGSYNNHLWSFPSEPVTLLVTGDVGNTSLASTEQPSSPDSWKPSLLTTKMEFQTDLALWDHTSQNLLRISLAFLVLVAAVYLLAKDWLCKKRTPEGADRASSQECRSFRTQRSLDE